VDPLGDVGGAEEGHRAVVGLGSRRG
jgi:hypothetical protein